MYLFVRLYLISLFFLLLWGTDLDGQDFSQDTSVVLSYYEKGKTFFPKEIDSVFHFYNLGLTLAEEIGYSKGEVTILRSRGVINGLLGRSDQGVSDIQRALSILKTASLPLVETVNCYINLGATYDRATQPGLALQQYILGEKIAREEGLVSKRSSLLNNIAIIYRKLERYQDALDIYEQAMAIRVDLKDSMGMANIYLNQSVCYGAMNQPADHLSASSKAIELYTVLDNKNDLLYAQASYGDALRKMGQEDEALQVLEKVRSADLSILRLAERMGALLSLAELYTNKGEYKESSEILNEVTDDLLQTDLVEYKSQYHLINAQNNYALGATGEAYQNLKSYVDIEREQTNSEIIKTRREMEQKYLAVEKDLKIELQESQIRKSKRDRWLLMLGLLSLGLISVLLFRMNRIRQKANNALDEKNGIIGKALSDKEILIKEIHHRVKNNLLFISSLLELQSEHITDKKAMGALQEGQNRVSSMALIHQHLYQEDNLTGVDVQDYFVKLIRGLFESYNVRKEQITLHLDVEDINLDVDTVIPVGLIVNELVSNSLKYAFPANGNGVIQVVLREEAEMLCITVSDDGVGMREEIKSSLGQSFGYRLIHVFKDQMKASLDIDGSDGTTVTMKISRYERV